MPQSITPAILNAADQVEADLAALDVSTRTLVQLLRAGEQHGGGGAGPDGTEYYVPITLLSSQVASTLTDFPVYVDLSGMPAGFWTNVQSDGGDIRVTENDGTTRVPVELVSIDTGGQTGELHFLAGSVSSSVDTVFRLYYGIAGGGLSQPGVATTYGRDAVWADYAAVYHGDSTTDSTGGGLTLSTAPDGSAPTAGTAGKVGDAQEFTGVGTTGSQAYTAGEGGGALDFGASTAFAVQAWIEPDGTATKIIVSKDYLNGPSLGTAVTEGYSLIQSATTGANFWARESGSTISAAGSGALTANTWYMLHGWRTTGGDVVLGMDGSVVATNAAASTADLNNAADLYIGARDIGVNNETSLPFDGKIDEVRIRTSALSADWIASEYTNQNTPATFYSVGSETPAS